MANKSEIGWKRTTEDGEKIQVFARRVGGEWFFFVRSRRYEQWQAVKSPPLEDWLALLDGVQRRIVRRLFPPEEAEKIKQIIRNKFPDFEFK